MSSFKRITLAFVFACLWSISAFAQSNDVVLGTGFNFNGAFYTGKLHIQAVETYSQCSASVPYTNCWIPVAGAPALKAISVAPDGDMWGINTSGALLHDVAGTWKATGFNPAQAIALGNGTVYLLTTSGTIYYFDGSSWHYNIINPYPTFFREIAVGLDGDTWALGEAVGCGYRVYHYDPTAKVWDSTTQMLTDIKANNSQDVWGVCFSGTSGANAYHFNGSTWSEDTGIGAKQIVATADGILFATGGSDFWYRPEGSTNSYMTKLTGQPSFINGVAENKVYGLIGTTLYKFQALTLQFTHNIFGQYGPDGCVPDQTHTCPTITHTGPITLQIDNHTQQTANMNVQMTAAVNMGPTDLYTPVEAYNCQESGTCLAVTATTGLKCSANIAAGAALMAYAISKTQIKWEMAHTRVILSTAAPHYGSLYDCRTVFGANVCRVDVKPWCSNTSTPDLNPPYIDGQPAGTTAWTGTWDASAPCIRIKNPLFNLDSGWQCSPDWPAPRNPSHALGVCDFNP